MLKKNFKYKYKDWEDSMQSNNNLARKLTKTNHNLAISFCGCGKSTTTQDGC
jgi:hypothetical protein